MIIHIPFETPSKKNSRVVNRRTGRSFPSPAYRKWHAKALTWIKANYKYETITEPVDIVLEFTHPTRRRKDGDNGTSSIFDLLVDARVIPDDCWAVINDHAVCNRYEKGKSECIVSILPSGAISDAVRSVLSATSSRSR